VQSFPLNRTRDAVQAENTARIAGVGFMSRRASVTVKIDTSFALQHGIYPGV
jgi:hypothetical protein